MEVVMDLSDGGRGNWFWLWLSGYIVAAMWRQIYLVSSEIWFIPLLSFTSFFFFFFFSLKLIHLYQIVSQRQDFPRLSKTIRLVHTHAYIHTYIHRYIHVTRGGVHSVMVIIVKNGHGDTSSNPGQECLHFT